MHLSRRLAVALTAGAVAAGGGFVAAPLHAFAGSGGSSWCFNNDSANHDTPLVNGVPIPGTTYSVWLGVEDGVPQGFPGHLAVCWDLGQTPPNVVGPAGSEITGGGVFVNVPTVTANYDGPCALNVCLPVTNQSWISVTGPIAGVSILGAGQAVNGPGCVYFSDATNPCTVQQRAFP